MTESAAPTAADHGDETAVATPATPHEQESNGGIGLERLIFFSDAVFAIAITLLVLDIRIPEIPDGLEVAELPGRVAEVIPNILAYFISFMIIAVYWLVHHGTFAYIRRYDRRLLWLNLYPLLFVAFVPFPAALLARYGNTFLAFTLYAVVQIAISLLLTIIWVHAARNHRLVEPDLDAAAIRHRFYRGLVPPLCFALSILVAYFFPLWGYALWFLAGIGQRGSARLERSLSGFTRAVERLVFNAR